MTNIQIVKLSAALALELFVSSCAVQNTNNAPPTSATDISCNLRSFVNTLGNHIAETPERIAKTGSAISGPVYQGYFNGKHVTCQPGGMPVAESAGPWFARDKVVYQQNVTIGITPLPICDELIKTGQVRLVTESTPIMPSAANAPPDTPQETGRIAGCLAAPNIPNVQPGESRGGHVFKKGGMVCYARNGQPISILDFDTRQAISLDTLTPSERNNLYAVPDPMTGGVLTPADVKAGWEKADALVKQSQAQAAESATRAEANHRHSEARRQSIQKCRVLSHAAALASAKCNNSKMEELQKCLDEASK